MKCLFLQRFFHCTNLYKSYIDIFWVVIAFGNNSLDHIVNYGSANLFRPINLTKVITTKRML